MQVCIKDAQSLLKLQNPCKEPCAWALNGHERELHNMVACAMRQIEDARIIALTAWLALQTVGLSRTELLLGFVDLASVSQRQAVWLASILAVVFSHISCV